MGYIFRINKGAFGVKSPIVDWSSSPNNPYNSGQVTKIKDSTTKQNEITSIPSPFARIELVKEAFGKIVEGFSNNSSVEQVKNMLHGETIYHKMVSDSLDVGQLFFNYPSMKDNVEIMVWNSGNIAELTQSEDKKQQKMSEDKKQQKIYGKSLEMFLAQDSMGQDPYNFGKMKNMYILRYVGPDHDPMHIIGATSPATLFFSTANDETSISKHLCFGNDYAFDNKYASLDMRDHDFLKYMFTLKYSISGFSGDYQEVNAYLDAVYYVLDDGMKQGIDSIQAQCANVVAGGKSYIDSTYNKLIVATAPNVQQGIEVNGNALHSKIVKVQGNSDFVIKATKPAPLQNLPLVLPVNKSSEYAKLKYLGSDFGNTIEVPCYDGANLNQRKLPGVGIGYPYLTISDLLYDKIIELPGCLNTTDYFDGNFSPIKGTPETGYLLPVKRCFFDYFSVEDLKGTTPSGKRFIEINELAAGIQVILRIPIQNGDVEYRRNYVLDVKPDEANNQGTIVLAPENFTVGVFPPVKFGDESDAQYRIAIMVDHELNEACTCECHNENGSFFTANYVIRNTNEPNDISSKVYILEQKSFDCALISIKTNQEGTEKFAAGLMVPNFRPQRHGASGLTFAIDLGTSNTHIEYTDGDDTMPKPFVYEAPMFSMICQSSDIVCSHARGEFLPETIGGNSECHFPMRTVLGLEKDSTGINGIGAGQYEAFGNASPAFMYNKDDVGRKYNDYATNLKWNQLSAESRIRMKCYIESLFMMIRTKVIQEGGSLANTQIRYFYPISMSTNMLGSYKQIWNGAYRKYFNSVAGAPVAITESIAPYSFFQKTRANVMDVVTVDIGGGTTDIVVADSDGVKLVTSMRFAGDAIFGSSLVPVKDGPLNGIVRQFLSQYSKVLAGQNGLRDLKELFDRKTGTNKGIGNSVEMASFLFSLEENKLVKQQRMEDMLSFNKTLQNDNSQKIVFYIFFCAIMWHLACLMKAKGLKTPANIAFSGNGSKVITILSVEVEPLQRLTKKIFSLVYDEDATNINLILNSDNPKEATCKGGLFMSEMPSGVSNTKEVLLGTNRTDLVKSQKYADVDEEMLNSVKEQVWDFFDAITIKIPKSDVISLKNDFGIDEEYVRLAGKCFNRNDLKTYITKGVKLKYLANAVSKDDIIEESLFFYPIIGVMNDISNDICEKINNGSEG